MTTPYRNEIDALRERKTSLEQELARLKEQTRELDGLRSREQELERELASVGARLGAGRRSLPMLDQIAVASPCNASWDEMVGDERVRFCLSCEKNVYNLSAMAREDAERLLQERAGGEVCVRYYKRADGTLMTSDCPVGVRRKRRKKVALSIAGAGALAVAATQAYARSLCGGGGHMQGAVAVMGEPQPIVPAIQGTASPAPTEPPDELMGKVSPNTQPKAPHAIKPPVDHVVGRLPARKP